MSADPVRAGAPRHLLLLIPLVVAAGLRLFRIGLPALTSDEAFSWRLVGYPPAEMLRRAAADVHPPLYYLALDAWTALFGSSPEALRGLSALLGVLAVAVAYALCLEASAVEATDPARARHGALFAAFLLAVQAASVAHGRNARMYALGVLLAGATAWLLLRALRAAEKGWAWWVAWGAAAAAACATHYYLLFTVAAQAAAVIVLPRLRAGGPLSATRAVLPRLAVGGLVAAALLGPWLPVFVRQAAEVREDYWIASPSLASVRTALVHWVVGAEVAFGPPRAWVVGLAIVLVLAWRIGGAGTRFLLLLALLPWVFGLGVSLASGRPVFLERYMAFAQLSLVCAWGVAGARMRGPAVYAARSAALLAAISVAGLLASARDRYPDRPTAFWYAARYLKRQAAAGDLVLARSPRALNKLRYYAEQAGAGGLDVRYLPSGAAYDDHYSHLPSLEDREVLRDDPFQGPGPATIWRVEDVRTAPEPAPPGWRLAHARRLEGGDAPVVLVAGYARGAADGSDPR